MEERKGSENEGSWERRGKIGDTTCNVEIKRKTEGNLKEYKNKTRKSRGRIRETPCNVDVVEKSDWRRERHE